MRGGAPTGPLKRAMFRLHLWVAARVLPLRVRHRSFDAVLGLAPLRTPTPYFGMPADYVARSVKRAARRPWLMRDRRCLREGLLGMRFLRYAGYQPELRFGLDPASVKTDRLAAHCWVLLDGKPVISDSQPGMIVIYRHGPTASMAGGVA